MAFASLHTERPRGEHPELTHAQVCRALVLACRQYLAGRRGSRESECLLDVLAYHQQRNAAARRSRQKRRRRPRQFTGL